MRRLGPLLGTLVFAGALVACVEGDPPHLRTLVTVIATQDGRAAEEATTRLVAEGRRSLVVIEAALHTAPAPGRRRLVRAVAQLGDRDGCALLGHFARYDESLEVRDAARAALTTWQADPHDPERSAAAERTLAALGAKPDLAPVDTPAKQR